ncbi:MAG: prepilin-type N-terminal cleavage/methylation domain-containing protein [bacterium]|nr:prepilin-type N-terminal cleavage/methylation domain-containing protein [Candidatus Margulisiibacteriota bacterium]
MKNKGFTLVELIVVVVLLGILSAMALPKFINMSNSAIEAKEDSVFGILQEAIAHQQLFNITNGVADANAWPTDNPFSLLQQVPPNRLWDIDSEGVNSQDGTNWRAYHANTMNEWWITCPHYNGTYHAQSISQGKFLIYCYGPPVRAGYISGELRLYKDSGH